MKNELIKKSLELNLNKENIINKSLNLEEEKKKVLLINLEQEKRKKKKLENEEKICIHRIISKNKITENLNQENNKEEKELKKLKITIIDTENKKEEISKNSSNENLRKKIDKNDNLKTQKLKKSSKIKIKINNSPYENNKILKTENKEPKILILPPVKIQTENSIKLKYCIYKGNNDKLIEKCFEYRKEIWEKSEYPLSQYCDLLWTPLSKDINFKMLENKKQYVNHLDYHDEITNKRNLFLTLLKYCEKKHYNLFTFFPFTIIFELKHKTLETQLKHFEYIYDKIENYICGTNTDLFNHKYNEIFYTYQTRKLGNEQRIFSQKHIMTDIIYG